MFAGKSLVRHCTMSGLQGVLDSGPLLLPHLPWKTGSMFLIAEDIQLLTQNFLVQKVALSLFLIL